MSEAIPDISNSLPPVTGEHHFPWVILILTSLYHQRNDEDHAGKEEDGAANKAQYAATLNTWGYKETSAHQKKNPTTEVELPFTVPIIRHSHHLSPFSHHEKSKLRATLNQIDSGGITMKYIILDDYKQLEPNLTPSPVTIYAEL